MGKRFYQITQTEKTADINIYGNITVYPWEEFGEVSAYSIKQEIDNLDVEQINVYINSYGGVVSEALAIYSALKRNKAKVHTYCDGFACSAATIVFAAGDERTVGSIALLMIHNCMSYLGYANSEEMRKAAEDNDKINQSSIEAYKKITNLSEDEIKEMMDAETWLTAEECLKYGFATDIAQDDDDTQTKQSAFSSIREAIISKKNQQSSMTDILQKLETIQSTLDGLQDKDGTLGADNGDEKANQKAINFFKNLI